MVSPHLSLSVKTAHFLLAHTTGSHCGKLFADLKITPFPPFLSLAGGLTRDHQANYLHATSTSLLSGAFIMQGGDCAVREANSSETSLPLSQPSRASGQS